MGERVRPLGMLLRLMAMAVWLIQPLPGCRSTVRPLHRVIYLYVDILLVRPWLDLVAGPAFVDCVQSVE